MPAFIIALIPFLVQQAENLIGSHGDAASGEEKHAWVIQMLKEIVGQLQSHGHLPKILEDNHALFENIVSQAIEKALDAIEG